jgi:hypothetical protein
MADEQTLYIDGLCMHALRWLAAGFATGVALAIVALDQEAASKRLDARAARAAAARIAPAFVTVSSALH